MSAPSATSSEQPRRAAPRLVLSCLAVGGLLGVVLSPEIATAQAGGDAHLDASLLTRGCGTCHRGHGKSGTPMLLAGTEETCLMCHGGVDPRMKDLLSEEARRRLVDLRPDFEAPFGHRLGSEALHRRREKQPETDPSATRHVTCLDCHDAHRPVATPLRLDGAAEPAPSTRSDATYLYEVCLRCHGDAANLPVGSRNIRADLHPGNRSYHPILGPRRQVASPSLRKPWSEGGQLSCLDCHGGARGRPGAHGSPNPSLLRETYQRGDRFAESELTYRLCYRCHQRQSILGDESFSGHRLHLGNREAQTSCQTCHNPHGSRENAHLIEFDPLIVRATRSGELRYDSVGTGRGSCTLTCHGVEHAPGNYCPRGEPCDGGSVKRVNKTGQAGQGLRGAHGPLPPGFGR